MAKRDPQVLCNIAQALLAGDVPAAIHACQSGGIGLFDEEGAARVVELILTRTPQALADCPPPYLPALRVAAALTELYGESSIKDFVTVASDYSYRHDPDTVAHLLWAHATHLRNLSRMADIGFTKVRVVASRSGDDCRVCRKDDDKVFPIATAPELPHPDCTCSDWCKCIVVVEGK